MNKDDYFIEKVENTILALIEDSRAGAPCVTDWEHSEEDLRENFKNNLVRLIKEQGKWQR